MKSECTRRHGYYCTFAECSRCWLTPRHSLRLLDSAFFLHVTSPPCHGLRDLLRRCDGMGSRLLFLGLLTTYLTLIDACATDQFNSSKGTENLEGISCVARAHKNGGNFHRLPWKRQNSENQFWCILTVYNCQKNWKLPFRTQNVHKLKITLLFTCFTHFDKTSEIWKLPFWWDVLTL